MDINKKLFAFLAIFLIFASMSVISAEDNATGDLFQDNGTDIPDEDPGDVGDNPYRHGELTPNEKAFLEDGDNDTDDGQNAAGGDSKAVSASGSPTTGNPILVLLAAIAVLGIYPLRRK